MALDDATLKSDLQSVFESQPDSAEDCATGMTDAIVAYLGGVEISYPPGPMLMPSAPSPIPDPTYGLDTKSVPVVPADSQWGAIYGGILGSINGSQSAGENIWSPADAAYSAAIVAIGAAWSTNDGYLSSGATSPAGIVDFGASWQVGLDGGSEADVAADLADRIHSNTTSATYTGVALKPPYVLMLPIIPPHASALS
jgi:hypothetical protein